MSRVVCPSGIASAAAYHFLSWLGQKIGLRKYFLKTQDLYALFASIFNIGNMYFKHDVADFVRVVVRIALECHLDQAALHFCHVSPRFVLFRPRAEAPDDFLLCGLHSSCKFKIFLIFFFS